MSDDNRKTYVAGLSFIGSLLFLVFCFNQQGNAAIASLTLVTVFWALIFVFVVEIVIVIIIVVIVVILGILLN